MRGILRILVLAALLTDLLDLCGAQIGQDVIIPNTQPIVAVGTRGLIVSSYDGGFNWVGQQIAGGSQIDLFGVFVFDDASAVAVGGDCNRNYGSASCGIFRRGAGTQAQANVEWTKASVGVGGGQGENLQQLTAVEFCNASLGIIAGEGGSLLRSTNAGATWGVVSSGTDENLVDVQCVRGGVILVAGAGGLLLRSVDAGVTWVKPAALTSSSSVIASAPLTALLFNSTGTGLVAGSGLWATEDRGLVWHDYKGAGSNIPVVVSGHAAKGLNPRHSVALLSAGGTRLLLWNVSVDAFDASAAPWESEILPPRYSGKSVLLAGQGVECRDCETVIIGGTADAGGNSACSSATAACAGTCCGPLQVRGIEGTAFRTAVSDGAEGIPVGCRSITDCSVIQGIAGTTGYTPPSPVVDETPPPSTPPPVEDVPSATVIFLVEAATVTAFKLSLFIDSLRPLIGIPDSYTPPATEEPGPDSTRKVTVSLSDQASFNATGAVYLALELAKRSEGVGSDICSTGIRNVEIPNGESADVDCNDYSIPWAVSTSLIVICVAYFVTGILLAFFFSLPKNQALPKNVYVAYALWLIFGLLGTHRYYLRLPVSATVWLCTAGLFGFGWLADSLLTYSNYRNTMYDRGLERADVPMRRIRNAPRPEYVTRREAVRMIAQRQRMDGDGGRIPTESVIEDLNLDPGGFGKDHFSPIMYPSRHKSDVDARRITFTQQQISRHQQNNMDEDGSLSVVV